MKDVKVPDNWRVLPVVRLDVAAAILGMAKQSIYRYVNLKELEIVKVAEKASAMPVVSIIRYLEKRGVPSQES